MVELTVGYVAGIIAAGVFLARIWAPNTITFIVSALLQDTASASTWTVAARVLYKSHWPDILQSDAVLHRGVRKDILFLTKLIGLSGLLIAVAGVVTPLGLYETLVPDKSVETPFKYLYDSSSWGYGTPPRSNFTFNRVCLQELGILVAPYLPCPWTQTIATIIDPGNDSIVQYEYPYGYERGIPNGLIDAYSSGSAQATTVSSFFDIQWRRYLTRSKEFFNNGTDYLVGSYRSIQTLIMNDNLEAVEGLVVNAKTGGIGFRNHTVPPGFRHGVTWEEDLLFVEPETVCVDTNLTIDFTVSAINESTIRDVVLTDRGGFVNINRTYPRLWFPDTQKDPELYNRAYKAAWLQNVYTMLWFNITNPYIEETDTRAFSYLKSEINKTFPLTMNSKYSTSGFDALTLSDEFGGYLDSSSGGTAINSSDPITDVNPFSISRSNFTTIKLLCTGAGSFDFANSSNIVNTCGLMAGVPQRVSPGSSLVFDKGSVWTQKLFTCSSAVKANIKTVSFNYNGTDNSLKDLHVTSIKEKEYKDESSMPLWGIENTGNKFRIGGINLIWGLLSSAYENKPNISTFRQPELYLPGFINPNGLGSNLAFDTQNLPASHFVREALVRSYCVGSSDSKLSLTSTCSDGDQDYSGASSMAMWVRWQNLTKSADTAALIPNLIWTDWAASAVVGTKGVLGPGNTAQSNVMALPLTPTRLRIRFHYLYGIPAMLAGLLLLIVSLGAMVTTCFHGVGIRRMRLHIRQISPGRIYTTFLFPGHGGLTMGTREWGSTLGRNQIVLSGDFPQAGSATNIEMPEKRKVNVYTHSVDGSTEAEVLMAGQGHYHGRDDSQGDIGAGYGLSPPAPYHNQYSGVPSQPSSPSPTNSYRRGV